ncbi:hypothetical protein FQN54_004487 [Arachnomyces sp. PD_36]|nr:hypothetical protein FQN54_004487 [Arachnomyces sp. PD_36]
MDKSPSEILDQILQEVFKSNRDPSLLLVNSQWFAHGITFVWSTARASDLLSVSKGRQQIYASAISELEIDPLEQETNPQLVTLKFPRLASLFFHNPQRQFTHRPPPPSVDLTPLHQLIPPGLRIARFEYVDDPGVLHFLQTNCRELEELRLQNQTPKFPDEILISSFRTLLFLRRVDVLVPEFQHLPLKPSMVEALAKLPKLRELNLNRDLTRETIEHGVIPMFSFPVLENLSLATYPSALPGISRVFGAVQSLTLRLQGIVDPEDYPHDWPDELETGGKALRELSKMTWLRELDITSLGWWACEPGDLLSLRNLTQLTTLSIRCGEQAPIQVRDFTDVHFRELFGSLSRLTSINLEVSGWNFTTASLAILGQCCPLLNTCDLEGESFDFFQLHQYNAPLFPNLESLAVRELIKEGGNRSGNGGPISASVNPQDYALQIVSHFPKLNTSGLYSTELMYWNSDDDADPVREFQRRVVDHFKMLRNDGETL